MNWLTMHVTWRTASHIFVVLLLACLLLSLLAPRTAIAALPNPLATSGSQHSEQVNNEQLAKSLDQVIQALENDQQRTELLNNLKQLRDATPASEPRDSGIFGLIGNTLARLENQLESDTSPMSRWSQQLSLARGELRERLPRLADIPRIIINFGIILALWGLFASAILWGGRQVRQRFGLQDTLPRRPGTKDLLLFALRKLGPWLAGFFIMAYLSLVLPDSLSKDLALVTTYVLVIGTLLPALCVICLSLLGGPHQSPALNILRHQAFRPLWVIGSLAALGGVAHEPQMAERLGENLAASLSNLANISAALLTALFVLRFRRPIAHLIRNQPLAARLKRRSWNELLELVGSLWYVPVLLLVISSLIATYLSVGDSNYALRRALLCAALMVVAITLIGLVRRASERTSQALKRSAPLMAQLQKFCFTLIHIVIILSVLEIGLRIWDLSLLRYAQGDGAAVSMHVTSFATTLLFAWLVWILADTGVQHMLGVHARTGPNARALTMLPLIRNVMLITIGVIALIVALANMGVNVTPLLAGAGVIGLAIGFGAQTLVTDLITGLFIIIEDSLAVDDYVDVANHIGTVEGLTIRTVRLRDLDGVVHTIPFSEIKSIKNYSRLFGYAMFRWPVPASMRIDDAQNLVEEVMSELRGDLQVNRHIWSSLEMQGIESFDNGQAILRFRFKTAPLKQWEVQRAFNLRLRRRLDDAGLELSMPRLNVQISRSHSGASDRQSAIHTGELPDAG